MRIYKIGKKQVPEDGPLLGLRSTLGDDMYWVQEYVITILGFGGENTRGCCWGLDAFVSYTTAAFCVIACF
jgi:hypothetical protein